MSIEATTWALNVPVGGTAKVILIGLANHASAEFDEARPAVDTLARYAHCDRRTVQRHLRNLEHDGWIERTGVHALAGRSDRAVSVWRLTGRQNATPPKPRGDIPDTNGATSEHARGDTAMPPEPSIEPSMNQSSAPLAPAREVEWVFAEWTQATERSRTQLTPDRRRCIQQAIASHGLDDCLAAVRNIGADQWARGANDRGKRFDDVKHALGNAERIERWRDAQQPLPAGVTPIRRGEDPEIAKGAAQMRALRIEAARRRGEMQQ